MRSIFLLLVFAAASVANAQSPAAGSPNIIIILADDLGYGDIGAYGATDILTPSIDRLANEGVRLTNFYTAASCSLTRSMLLTGSYAPRVSIARNFSPSSISGIHSDEVTLGEVLQGGSYLTGAFGKWHLGDHYQFRPQRNGFDEFFGIPYSGDMWPFHPRTAYTPGEDPRLTSARQRAELTGFAGQGSTFPVGRGFPNLPLYEGDAIVEFNPDQATFGAAFIDRALEFIESHSTERFFAYIPLTSPHVPLHPSAMFVGTSSRDLFGDTVQEVDDGVGRILNKLVELGIDNETLVIFLSDNGPWLEYGIDGGSAGSLAGGKATQFEGGIRVPALLRWPGELAPASVIDEPMAAIDILPTLAGLAGVPVPSDRTIDGVDIWPLLTGDVASLPRPALFGFHEGEFSSVNLGAVRSGQWKLHVSTNGTTVSPLALYDLASDIGETTDLKSGQGAIVSSLIALGKQIVADIRSDQRPLGQVALSGDPFAQKAGLGDIVAIEAEHFHTREARAGQSWEIVAGSDYSAGGAIQALPNIGTINNSNYETNSPHATYRVIFETPGRYYVSVRGVGPSGGDDSVHIGLDGQAIGSGSGLIGFNDSWDWAYTLMTDASQSYVDVQAAGEHEIDVWMREDGVVLDKIILTTDPNFRPAGKGPVESRQSYDGLSIPPVATNDGPFAIDEGGSLSGQPNILDNDAEPRNDPKTAVLVSGPTHAEIFELRSGGTFDYKHDGSETVSDSFTYTANDVDGASNEAVVSLIINAINDLPTITLNGATTVNVTLGIAYTDQGATAQDAEDGDISGDIIVAGDPVDVSTLGTYVITYNVVDSVGGVAVEASRTVRVVAPTLPPPPVQSVRSGGSISLLETFVLCFLLLAYQQGRSVRRRRRQSAAIDSGCRVSL